MKHKAEENDAPEHPTYLENSEQRSQENREVWESWSSDYQKKGGGNNWSQVNLKVTIITCNSIGLVKKMTSPRQRRCFWGIVGGPRCPWSKILS